jgi:solute:Na+ symporter, SSS family
MPLLRILFIFLFAALPIKAQNASIRWSEGPPLAKPEWGVGGAFVGTHGDAIILAGGTLYPEALPWKGGTKTFKSTIHVLIRNSVGEWQWIPDAGELPSARGYGATISLPDGVLCIGGCDATQVFSECVLLRYDPETKKVTSKPWPALDTPLMMATGALVGTTAYVVGGQISQAAAPGTHSKQLDLTQMENKAAFKWQPAPSWDGPGRALAAATSQNDATGPCLWMFSGRTQTPDGTYEALTDAWKFKPSTQTWTKLPDIKLKGEAPRAAVGAASLAYASHVLLLGGDDGTLTKISEILSRRGARTPHEQDAWRKFHESLLDNHPGYTSDVLALDTVSEQWGLATSAPSPLPVTNPVALWKNHLIFLSGEDKPGRRALGVVISEWPVAPIQEAPIPKAIPVEENKPSVSANESLEPPDEIRIPNATTNPRPLLPNNSVPLTFPDGPGGGIKPLEVLPGSQ